MSNKKRRPKWGRVHTYARSKAYDKKFPLARCRGCPLYSCTIVRDVETGTIEKELICQNTCEYYQLSRRQK